MKERKPRKNEEPPKQRRVWRTFTSYFALVVIKGSAVLVFLVGIVFLTVVLQNYRSDTTRITNTAFGITAVLASLCFSCACAIGDKDKDRDRFAYAGERFMHGSIFLIIASILKYALLTVQATAFSLAHTTFTQWLLIHSAELPSLFSGKHYSVLTPD